MEKKNIPLDELHKKAMDLADQAFYDKKNQNLEEAQEKYLRAIEYERAAAMLLINDFNIEPTRSVLFRSTASMILNLPFLSDQHLRKAEIMVAHGLSGNPPREIAIELRNIWQELMNLFEQRVA